MSPETLSAKGTESGHQKALFAWAAMAQLWGFEIADDMGMYTAQRMQLLRAGETVMTSKQVKALKWLHAIPNGGYRDPVTAARMKAEGVKSGVPDVFLPVCRTDGSGRECLSHGLYIEMKKPKGGVQSTEQKQFAEHCELERFDYVMCKSWREAADQIKAYLTY